MTKLPLGSMQILGNKLLRRPELIIVLPRTQQPKAFSTEAQGKEQFQEPNSAMKDISPAVGNSPQQLDEEQRTLHACLCQRQ